MTTVETLVSIIIPVYNAATYLPETLHSILALQLQQVEIIIVDDGSTDSSKQIAENFADGNPVMKVLEQPNRGAAAARNAGIAQANGKYMLPFDSDDLLCSNFIEEAVRMMENDSQIKVVTAQGEFFGESTGLWNLPDFSLYKLAHRNMLPVCSLYRKSDWERIGGYCTEFVGREDWDFWIALLKDGGQVVRLPFVGFKYRMHKNSKRNRTRKFKRKIFELLNQRHPDFFKQQLNGPLRLNRKLSKPFNTFLSFWGLLS